MAFLWITVLFWAYVSRCCGQPLSPENTWAVLVAGSSGYGNYRHQADICHAYQIMKKHGISEDHLIVMATDDIAHNSLNPFPGQVFNRPGNQNATDVYAGCKIDYKGHEVTPDTFTKVLTGVQDGTTNGKKVLKSDSTSRVFVNFVDHGGVGIIGFPSTTMHVADLTKTLDTMQQKKTYGELLFYLEACESGSMFPNLSSTSKIYAVTAANGKESSWGYYCMPQDVVKGKHIGSCLGDLFSISWMEDADLNQPMETIAQQVEKVTKRTNKSHVTTFGDTSFTNEPIAHFDELKMIDHSGVVSEIEPLPEDGIISAQDIPLAMAQYKYLMASPGLEKDFAKWHLETVKENRKEDHGLFHAITDKACEKSDQNFNCTSKLQTIQMDLKDLLCHKALASIIEKECLPHNHGDDYQVGGWNAFSWKFSQWLVNICESQDSLNADVDAFKRIVSGACTDANAAKMAKARAETVQFI